MGSVVDERGRDVAAGFAVDGGVGGLSTAWNAQSVTVATGGSWYAAWLVPATMIAKPAVTISTVVARRAALRPR